MVKVLLISKSIIQLVEQNVIIYNTLHACEHSYTNLNVKLITNV